MPEAEDLPILSQCYRWGYENDTYSWQTQGESAGIPNEGKQEENSINCKTTEFFLFSKRFQNASYESDKAKPIKIRNSTISIIYIHLILGEDIFLRFQFQIQVCSKVC